MADSFFEFNTSLTGLELDDAPDLDEEEYDALNHETFGDNDFQGDWEADHTRFAEVTENSRIYPSCYNSDNDEDDEDFDEDDEDLDLEASLSQLVLEDGDEEEVVAVNQIQTRKSIDKPGNFKSINKQRLASSPIWSTDCRKHVSPSNSVQQTEDPPAPNYSAMRFLPPQLPKIPTVQELERDLLQKNKQIKAASKEVKASTANYVTNQGRSVIQSVNQQVLPPLSSNAPQPNLRCKITYCTGNNFPQGFSGMQRPSFLQPPQQEMLFVGNNINTPLMLGPRLMPPYILPNPPLLLPQNPRLMPPPIMRFLSRHPVLLPQQQHQHQSQQHPPQQHPPQQHPPPQQPPQQHPPPQQPPPQQHPPQQLPPSQLPPPQLPPPQLPPPQLPPPSLPPPSLPPPPLPPQQLPPQQHPPQQLQQQPQKQSQQYQQHQLQKQPQQQPHPPQQQLPMQQFHQHQQLHQQHPHQQQFQQHQYHQQHHLLLQLQHHQQSYKHHQQQNPQQQQPQVQHQAPQQQFHLLVQQHHILIQNRIQPRCSQATLQEIPTEGQKISSRSKNINHGPSSKNHLPDRRGAGDYDEYAGLMNNRERIWLKNIQLIQLTTEKPHMDDYYYTEWLKKQDKKVKKTQTKNGIKKDKTLFGNNKKNQNNGGNRGRKDADRDLLTNPSPRVYVPLQFENSLGKLQCVSFTAPRKIIDLDVVSEPQTEAPVTIHRDSKKTKKLLLELERLYLMALEIEEIDSKIRLEEKKSTKPELLDKIINSFLNENRFVSFMCIRKGKALLLRILKHLNGSDYNEQLSDLWCRTIKSIAMVVRRDQNDGILLQMYPYFDKWINSAAYSNLSVLTSFLLTGNSIPVRSSSRAVSPVSGKTVLSVSLASKFGVSVITSILSRGEVIFPDLEEKQQLEWSTFVFSFMKQMTNVPNLENIPSPLEPLKPEIVSSLLNRSTGLQIQDYASAKRILNCFH